MSSRLILLPANLHELGAQAELSGRAVALTAQQVLDIAEHWHEDKKKIEYLESLIVRIGKN